MGDPAVGRVMGRVGIVICVSVMSLPGIGRSGAALAGDAAAANPPKYWAVTGVALDDVLNMRDVPHGDSKKLGAIPPNAHGLKHLGCIKPEPSLDRWMTMTEDEKKNAKLEWCRVEYHGQQGWVAARFLKPDDKAP
ncbi:hypothetical protein [uncultured Hyphomicrobium sp.]|uniref:SH3 domain-containing protein n=1 Tax=uncultured Hyphomicrobium sp. TaxID=194373 RepID=UPI0025CF9F00|nr:hypothetical protein [uncultured Hyphomicrobium sp.]